MPPAAFHHILPFLLIINDVQAFHLVYYATYSKVNGLFSTGIGDENNQIRLKIDQIYPQYLR